MRVIVIAPKYTLPIEKKKHSEVDNGYEVSVKDDLNHMGSLQVENSVIKTASCTNGPYAVKLY